MIDGLRGRLVRTGQSSLVIEVGGVSLAVSVPVSSPFLRRAPGEEVQIPTHLSVREDAMELFGFSDERERSLFLMLRTISGIGPRLALAIVGALSSAALVAAVAAGDTRALQRAPGVGRKLAQRMLLELKDKLDLPDQLAPLVSAPGQDKTAGGPWQDAGLALGALGFDATRIAAALARVRGRLNDEAPTAEIVRNALHVLRG